MHKRIVKSATEIIDTFRDKYVPNDKKLTEIMLAIKLPEDICSELNKLAYDTGVANDEMYKIALMAGLDSMLYGRPISRLYRGWRLGRDLRKIIDG